MSAYACRRDVGSESENGYNYLRAAAQRHNVTVLTHPEYVEGLAEAMRDGDLAPVEVISFPTPRWTARAMGRLGVGHLDYLLWQRHVRLYALAHRHRYDVLHHATFGSDWFPVGLLAVRDVPVVWGSVGGQAPVPWRLARYLSPTGLAVEAVRECITRILRVKVRRDVGRARCLVVARNNDTGDYFTRHGADVVVDPHVVALPDPLPALPRPADQAIHRVLFVSRLLPWKGPLLAVHALAHLDPRWQLEFFGVGPAAARIERTAAKLNVSDRVTMHGRRPKSEVLQALREADVLLFPSMHDSAPMPVAEAAWAGCPVVCLDVAGPPVLIEGTTGRAIRPDRHAARHLAAAVAEVRRHEPTDRWGRAPLVDSVDGWYVRASALR